MTATENLPKLAAHVLLDAVSAMDSLEDTEASNLALERLGDLGGLVTADQDGRVNARPLLLAALVLTDLAIAVAADGRRGDKVRDVLIFLIRSHLDEAFP